MKATGKPNKVPKGFAVDVLAFDEQIHPADAVAAVVAQLKKARKTRPKATLERVLEDMFLATLATHRPWSEKEVRRFANVPPAKISASDLRER
jgi:hypothetical protein